MIDLQYSKILFERAFEVLRSGGFVIFSMPYYGLQRKALVRWARHWSGFSATMFYTIAVDWQLAYGIEENYSDRAIRSRWIEFFAASR